MKQILNFLFAAMILIFSKPLSGQVADQAENICPLLVGESLPSDSIADSNGKNHLLLDIVSKKPTVLVVFRGGWCPYCNVQLSGLGKAEDEILKLGYQIIAISPDDFKNIPAIEEKDELKYQLYSDIGAGLISKMGIAFNSGPKRGILPVPTVLVLNQKGVIQFEHINPNYKQRMGSDYLLAVLNALKSNK